ncbi:hypothetical protein [Maridesulfovibrio hydrothermalis]|uniref:Uncharacterized protein n=1 Tax=Maridesulfovibrio hydrothermalis AM13 = DSM 14728 TaxID=1121451 RepID=L0RB78_9BACT|nr:hypothetical protein [Maridesulfovibrio hydrothermalis]CCO22836.1 conserved protein of unknown function [Maridesulfovibrio hydrothermalis AM13 = DSM 14728]
MTMKQNQVEEESKSISIPELEELIANFKKELELCKERTRSLMAQENPSKGIFFAKEIFESQQDKLRLETEIDIRQKKINRIRLGMEGI